MRDLFVLVHFGDGKKRKGWGRGGKEGTDERKEWKVEGQRRKRERKRGNEERMQGTRHGRMKGCRKEGAMTNFNVFIKIFLKSYVILEITWRLLILFVSS